jgi:hypothetical protein
LIEAVAEYFQRDMVERGPDSTALLFALFVHSLRCGIRHEPGDSERAARGHALAAAAKPTPAFLSPPPQRAPAWATSSANMRAHDHAA